MWLSLIFRGVEKEVVMKTTGMKEEPCVNTSIISVTTAEHSKEKKGY